MVAAEDIGLQELARLSTLSEVERAILGLERGGADALVDEAARLLARSPGRRRSGGAFWASARAGWSGDLRRAWGCRQDTSRASAAFSAFFRAMENGSGGWVDAAAACGYYDHGPPDSRLSRLRPGETPCAPAGRRRSGTAFSVAFFQDAGATSPVSWICWRDHETRRFPHGHWGWPWRKLWSRTWPTPNGPTTKAIRHVLLREEAATGRDGTAGPVPGGTRDRAPLALCQRARDPGGGAALGARRLHPETVLDPGGFAYLPRRKYSVCPASPKHDTPFTSTGTASWTITKCSSSQRLTVSEDRSPQSSSPVREIGETRVCCQRT